MATTKNFEKAYKELLGVEGTYSNNKNDKGGETWCGIARNYNKSWKGWTIIDQYKAANGGKVTKAGAKELAQNKELMDLVYSFYKTKYWDIFECDAMPYSLAHEVFEQSVNLGASRCAKIMQHVLNAMNYKSNKVYGFGSDLVVDGKWGPASKARLKDIVKAGYAKQLQFGINCLQGAYYVKQALAISSQREFLKGWLGQRTEAKYSEK